MSDTIVVVMLYAPERLKPTIGFLRELMALNPGSRPVFVSNNAAIKREDIDRHFPGKAEYELIYHDNTGMEFGAYQRGIDSIGDSDYAGVFVVNDTIRTNDYITSRRLRRFSTKIREFGESNFISGIMAVRTRQFHIREHALLYWIRSNLFYIDKAALEKIGRRIYVPELEDLICGDAEAGKFFADDLAVASRQVIERWLFVPGPDAWHNAHPLNSENWAFMAAKARSILQESFLSMRLAEQDAAFLVPSLRLREMALDLIEQRLRKALI